MKEFSRLQNASRRGGALAFAMILIMVATLLMSFSLKSSLNLTQAIRFELRSSSLEIKIKDHFKNIQQNLTDQISIWMRVRSLCDQLNLAPTPCANAANNNDSFDFLTPEQLPFVAKAAGGEIPLEAIKASYIPIAGESFSWRSVCIENCRTDPETYPKRFSLTVSAIDLDDQSTEVAATGIIEVSQASLSDYSILALGISGNFNFNLMEDAWPSFPIVGLGAGNHGRVGLFFDNGSLSAFKTENNQLPTAKRLPTEQIGAIHFFTKGEERVNLRRLHTNVPLTQIHRDTSGPTNTAFSIPTGTRAVFVQEGISSGLSPSDEVQLQLRSTAESDPTLRQKDSTFSSGNECNSTDDEPWRRPHRAIVTMSCTSAEACNLTVTEWRRQEEASLPDTDPFRLPALDPALIQCSREIVNGPQKELHNKIIYTSAKQVLVSGSNQLDAPPSFGNANFTIIAEGSFYPTHSFEKKQIPTTGAGQEGNIALISLGDHAIRLSSEFTTIPGVTLENRARSTNSNERELTVNLPVAAITTAEGKSPIYLQRNLITDSGMNTLGRLKSEGALWGFNPSALRLVIGGSGNTIGSVKGFNIVETSYPQDAILYPPPGISIQTSGMHSSSIASFSITRNALKSLMAEKNLPWVDE